MEELKILLQKILNKDLQQIILSNSRNPEQIQKVKIRPVLIRDELLFQETRYKGTQVFHENYTAAQITMPLHVRQKYHRFSKNLQLNPVTAATVNYL